MMIQDASREAAKAIRRMKRDQVEMGITDALFFTVPAFRVYAAKHPLAPEDRETIVDQAIQVLDQLYVHLPFKRARYAVDPVQRLRLLRSQLKKLSDLAFHKEMLQAFNGLRDAHTFYGLPYPYRSAVAFLPFSVKCYLDGKERRFLVTSVMDGFKPTGFGLHSEIKTWNGMPVERAIAREGGFDPLGNEAARFVRGLQNLCSRPLSYTTPPEEDWVVITYRSADPRNDEEDRGLLAPWFVSTNFVVPDSNSSSATSVNGSMLETAQAAKYIMHRKVLSKERLMKGAYGSGAAEAGGAEQGTARLPDLGKDSKYPAQFSFWYSPVKTSGEVMADQPLYDPANPTKRFSYLRIWNFFGPSAGEFVAELERILRLLQEKGPDGLIVDIRSNPGGAVDAAERALGLLSPSGVKPALFSFLNTRLTQQIAHSINKPGAGGSVVTNQEEWQPWVNDLIASVFSGSVITAGRELTSSTVLNADVGQCYQGPVALLTDARTYSAADIFAAGFQDNKIGQIIGVDENTGGGGANRWLHEDLRNTLQQLPDLPLKELPAGAQLGLAVRRSIRVGENAGKVIEDVGVTCDIPYRITKNDLLKKDVDLMRFACAHLGKRRRHLLRIESARITKAGVEVKVASENLHRLEFRLNQSLQCSHEPDNDGTYVVPVKGLAGKPGRLRVNGYALERPWALKRSDQDQRQLLLVASSVVQLPFPVSAEPSVPK
jgi:hypothetical protein